MAWTAAVVAMVAILLRQLPFRHRTGPATLTADPPRDDITWPNIERWIASGERPVESYEPDFFGHRAVATRIADIVGCEGRRVALLGTFGTGKSSILNAVHAVLDKMESRVIVASVDIWAAEKA